jgi:phospholipid-binding lipoprotein MlaA
VKHTTATRLVSLVLSAALLLPGCAATQEPGVAYDPFEDVNRGVYAFNESLDEYVLEPAARGWKRITPAELRLGFSNFFDNLAYPGVVLNDLLQGKFEHATRGSIRFVINSTLGVAGFFDPASRMGLENRNEDFGQTLGVWGAEPGAYLTLPLLGPSSVRDVNRYPVEYFTNMLTLATVGAATGGALLAINVVNTRAQLEGADRLREEAALDPYAFTRSAYMQYRRNQVYDGNPPATQDPFEEFFENYDPAGAQ